MKTVQMGPLNTLKRRTTNLALGLGLAATLAFGAVMPAMAADPVIEVQAGTLSISSVPTITPTGDQTAIVRDGTDHARTFTVNSTVTDFRQDPDTYADAAGWKVNMSMGAFLDGVATMGATAIPTASISKVNAASTSATEVTSDFGTLTNQIGGPASLTPGGAAGLDIAKIFSAAEDHGVGVYTFTPTVTVTVPAEAAPGTYTSVLTVSVDTAP